MVVVEIRRRFRASAKSEPSFLRERLTGRGNELDERDRIMFNISYSSASTVQNTGRYSKRYKQRVPLPLLFFFVPLSKERRVLTLPQSLTLRAVLDGSDKIV